MTNQYVEVLSPPAVAAPRGAEWAARATIAVQGACGALWRALEESGRRRAARELRRLADLWEPSDPELARTLRAAIQRNSVD